MLPGSCDGIGALRRIDFGELGVLAGGIDPFAPPPGLRFVEPASVVIARQVVDLLASMSLERAELPDNLQPFFVFGGTLSAGKISKVQRNIPIEPRCALGLLDCRDQAFPAVRLVAGHVR